MATPHISSRPSDGPEGAGSCSAPRTGLQFAELNSHTGNTAGNMGSFCFKLCGTASPPFNTCFWNPSWKRAFSDLKNKTLLLFFFLSCQAKNKNKVNLPLATFRVLLSQQNLYNPRITFSFFATGPKAASSGGKNRCLAFNGLLIFCPPSHASSTPVPLL